MEATRPRLKMLSLEQILSSLSATAARFPVERWRIGGIHVWPLVRYEVASHNFELTARPTTGARRAGAGQRALAWSRRALESRLRPAEVLVYSDGVSFVEFDSAPYDRFADPVRDLAMLQGLSTAVITPHDRHDLRLRDTMFVQPFIDGAQRFAALASRVRVEHDLQLEEFPAAMDFLRERGAHQLPGVERLARTVSQIEVHSALASVALRFVRPRVALLPSYIGTERMAFILACRRLGIPSVDLQHGAAGETHWAYGGFGRAPAGGYELLPERFWCWSSADAEAIEKWAAGTHVATVAGVPMVEAWRRGLVPGVEAARAKLERRCASRDREAAFILSGYETDELLEAYAQAVLASSSYFFWFRTHPLRPEQAARLERRLTELGVAGRAEVRLSSEAPLYALLERVDALVLELSSSAYEAAQFGVPSLVVSESNARVYADLQSRGLVRHTPPQALPRSLDSLQGRRKRGAPTSDTEQAIRTLLSP